MTDSLTTNLRLEVEKTNQLFSRYCENQMDWLRSNDCYYERLLSDCNNTIQALRENELELEESRVLHMEIKKKQNDEVIQLMQRNETGQNKLNQLQQQVRTCEELEEQELQRMNRARIDHDLFRSKMEQSLNDLTHGIRHYTNLGLDFFKDNGECMKFVFSCIDPKDSSKQFYFLMYVDNENLYKLVETNPRLDTTKCAQLLNKLNTTNDIGSFIVNIRRMFQSQS